MAVNVVEVIGKTALMDAPPPQAGAITTGAALTVTCNDFTVLSPLLSIALKLTI